MALYSFKCDLCGDTRDVFVPMDKISEYVAVCPRGHYPMRRELAKSLTLQPEGSLGDGYFSHRDRHGVEHRGNAKMAGKKRTRWV